MYDRRSTDTADYAEDVDKHQLRLEPMSRVDLASANAVVKAVWSCCERRANAGFSSRFPNVDDTRLVDFGFADDLDGRREVMFGDAMRVRDEIRLVLQNPRPPRDRWSVGRSF